MTTEDLSAQFDSEWIVLADPVIENSEVKGGILVSHGKDRDAVYDKASEVPLIRNLARNLAFMYTGKIPEGTVVMI